MEETKGTNVLITLKRPPTEEIDILRALKKAKRKEYLKSYQLAYQREYYKNNRAKITQRNRIAYMDKKTPNITRTKPERVKRPELICLCCNQKAKCNSVLTAHNLSKGHIKRMETYQAL